MQNSFEKQVKNKMDELQFVPTAPVWQNIEKQIRTKKDRKRLILWLPFLCLFLCGGIWWFSTGNHSSTIGTTNNKPAANETVIANKSFIPNTKTLQSSIERKNTTQPIEENNTAQQEIINDKIEPAVIKRNYLLNNDLSLLKKPSRSAKQTDKAFVLASPKFRETNEKIIASSREDVMESEELHQPVGKETPKPFLPKKADTSLQKAIGKKDSTVKYKVADVKVDTTNKAIAVAKRSPKKKSSKWKFGALANVGTSGIGKGLGSLSLNKSLDAMAVGSPTTIPQNNSQNPSPVKNDLSFSIGFVARKKLSGRITFSTGLQYNYYSTNITVGKMRQDSAVYNYSLAQSFSRYYMNSGTSFKDYHNQYHFISLPVSVDWQMLKKVPLSLQAGLSLQQLISTNALLYDAQNNIYFTDKSLFNKTQLFSNLGISYAIINKEKTSMLIGPQMQYGISKLDKNGSPKHLFSLGITALILFQKK